MPRHLPHLPVPEPLRFRSRWRPSRCWRRRGGTWGRGIGRRERAVLSGVRWRNHGLRLGCLLRGVHLPHLPLPRRLPADLSLLVRLDRLPAWAGLRAPLLRGHSLPGRRQLHPASAVLRRPAERVFAHAQLRLFWDGSMQPERLLWGGDVQHGHRLRVRLKYRSGPSDELLGSPRAQREQQAHAQYQPGKRPAPRAGATTALLGPHRIRAGAAVSSGARAVPG